DRLERAGEGGHHSVAQALDLLTAAAADGSAEEAEVHLPELFGRVIANSRQQFRRGDEIGEQKRDHTGRGAHCPGRSLLQRRGPSRRRLQHAVCVTRATCRSPELRRGWPASLTSSRRAAGYSTSPAVAAVTPASF